MNLSLSPLIPYSTQDIKRTHADKTLLLLSSPAVNATLVPPRHPTRKHCNSCEHNVYTYVVVHRSRDENSSWMCLHGCCNRICYFFSLPLSSTPTLLPGNRSSGNLCYGLMRRYLSLSLTHTHTHMHTLTHIRGYTCLSHVVHMQFCTYTNADLFFRHYLSWRQNVHLKPNIFSLHG